MGLREFSNVPADPRDWGRWMRAQFITADSVAPNTITTGMIVDANVTFAKIQDIAALSVLGRPVNSIGVTSAIAASSDLTLLRRSGLSVGFGTATSAYISDFNEAAQDAALAAITDSAELDWTYNDGAGTASASLVAASVANSKLANMAADRIKGRANGAGTGDPTDLTAAQVATIISSAIASALNITSGTYTPTLTNVTNLDSTTAAQCQYLRVLDMVIVSGRFTADATAAASTQTEFGMSLPIASNLGAREDLAGVGSTQEIAGLCVNITADAANDRASIRWASSDAGSRLYSFIFFYQVI